MKKLIPAIMATILIFTGCQDGQNANSPTNEDNKPATQSADTQNQESPQKKDDDKQTQDTKTENEGSEKKDDTSQKVVVPSIYIKGSSVIFGDNVKSDSLEEFIKSNNISLKDKSTIEITMQGDKITDVKEVDNISANAVYVGLVDSNTAEFSYNSKSFVVKISPDEMTSLDGTDSNSLIHVNLRSSEDGNLILSSFSFEV